VEALGSAGLHKIDQDIPFGPDIDRVPGAFPGAIGFCAFPEGEAFVVFGREGDIFGSRFYEGIGPMVRIV